MRGAQICGEQCRGGSGNPSVLAFASSRPLQGICEVVPCDSGLTHVLWGMAAPTPMKASVEALLERAFANQWEDAFRFVLALTNDWAPAEDRAALVLKAIEGMSYEETAQVLGTTEAACRAAVSRARAKLEAA